MKLAAPNCNVKLFNASIISCFKSIVNLIISHCTMSFCTMLITFWYIFKILSGRIKMHKKHTFSFKSIKDCIKWNKIFGTFTLWDSLLVLSGGKWLCLLLHREIHFDNSVFRKLRGFFVFIKEWIKQLQMTNQHLIKTLQQ